MSNLKQIPPAMKCHINNEKRSSTHTWIPLRNWRLPTTSQLALHNLYLGPCLTMIAAAVSKLTFLCSRLCCRDIDPNLPNTEHSLEEQFLNLATATSLHGSWCRTWNKCHRSWNVTSTMRKRLPQHTPGSPWETGGYLQLRSLHCTISIWDHIWPW